MINVSSLNFSASRRLPVVMQSEAAECGLACLAMIAGYHGYATDLLSLRQRFSISMRGTTLKNLIEVATALNFDVRPIKVELEDIAFLKIPCILHWNANHFVVLNKVKRDKNGNLISIEIHDPSIGKLTVPIRFISTAFTGIALELYPSMNFQQETNTKKLSVFDLLKNIKGIGTIAFQVLAMAIALEFFLLLGPLFLQLIVDGPVGSSDKAMLNTWGLGFIFLITVQTFIGAFRSWVVLYFSTHWNVQWASGAFAHLLSLPMNFFERRYLGDVISRFNSVNMIQKTLSQNFIETVLDGLMALTTLFVMIIYSMKLTLFVLIAVCIYCVIRKATFNKVRKASQEQLLLQAQEQSIFLESIRGIQTIKLANKERDRHIQWLNALCAGINRSVTTQKYTLIFSTSSGFLKNFEYVLIVWLGASLIIDQTFSIGMFFAFLAYRSVFTSRAYALIDRYQEIRMLSLQSERLGDILLTDREQTEDMGFGSDKPALNENIEVELKNIAFRYSDADPWVLRDVNLKIRTGESVALIGNSGCGKTTLLKIILGVLTPTQGEILIGGLPLARFGIKRYRSMVAAVMQDDQLFAGTVEENIAFFGDILDTDQVIQCARAAFISDEINAMPMQYKTLIGDMGTALSGGQKQRLLLARAFYKNPRILFLDEATSHLDVPNEVRVNNSINNFEMTRIIVAHRPETIASVERVVELLEGRVKRDFLQNQNKPCSA